MALLVQLSSNTSNTVLSALTVYLLCRFAMMMSNDIICHWLAHATVNFNFNSVTFICNWPVASLRGHVASGFACARAHACMQHVPMCQHMPRCLIRLAYNVMYMYAVMLTSINTGLGGFVGWCSTGY